VKRETVLFLIFVILTWVFVISMHGKALAEYDCADSFLKEFEVLEVRVKTDFGTKMVTAKVKLLRDIPPDTHMCANCLYMDADGAELGSMHRWIDGRRAAGTVKVIEFPCISAAATDFYLYLD
jgi:hypothetical protein